MTANGAEQRFWLYFDTANQHRHHRRLRAPAKRGLGARFDPVRQQRRDLRQHRPRGNPNGYTADNYTTVGTYATGWTEFRIVYDFTGPAPDLHAVQARERHRRRGRSSRPPALRLRHPVPRRRTPSPPPTGLLFRAYQNTNLWLDDVRFSDNGITDGDTTPPTPPLSSLALDHPADQGGAIDITWPAATDNVGVTGYKLYRGTDPGILACCRRSAPSRATPTPRLATGTPTTTRSPPSTPPATRARFR